MWYFHLFVHQTLLLMLVLLSRGDCDCSKLSRQESKPVTTHMKQVTVNESANSSGTCSALSYVDSLKIAGQYLKRGKMVLINSGSFIMGNNDVNLHWRDGEHPEREVFVNSFYMDETEVTNQAFAAFVEDTNYVTTAEQYNESAVFNQQTTRLAKSMKLGTPLEPVPWWQSVKGASWKHPYGPGSSWDDIKSHPVVHVSWEDAVEYCQWAGKRLPTEAEWEYACRGGRAKKDYPWGNNITVNEKHRMNTWQGVFPTYNSAEDGFKFTAPVRSFPCSAYGLYEMTGNVWEWVDDWFTMRHHEGPLYNPQGPATGIGKVKKGGSFMCHHSYCNRYRCSARRHSPSDSSASNLGFRCVREVPVSQVASIYLD